MAGLNTVTQGWGSDFLNHPLKIYQRNVHPCKSLSFSVSACTARIVSTMTFRLDFPRSLQMLMPRISPTSQCNFLFGSGFRERCKSLSLESISEMFGFYGDHLLIAMHS